MWPESQVGYVAASQVKRFVLSVVEEPAMGPHWWQEGFPGEVGPSRKDAAAGKPRASENPTGSASGHRERSWVVTILPLQQIRPLGALLGCEIPVYGSTFSRRELSWVDYPKRVPCGMHVLWCRNTPEYSAQELTAPVRAPLGTRVL